MGSDPGVTSALLHEEGELGPLRGGEQLVAGLAAEGLEVLHRAGIGRHDLEHLPGGKVAERLLGTQDGKRAIEPAHVEFAVGLHGGLMRETDNSTSLASRDRGPGSLGDEGPGLAAALLDEAYRLDHHAA